MDFYRIAAPGLSRMPSSSKDANDWAATTGIFVDIPRTLETSNTIIVIDALDECETDLAKLLDFYFHRLDMPRVKWVLSSRGDEGLRKMPVNISKTAMLILDLDENSRCISGAANAYIATMFLGWLY